ncbi:MAG: VOC family protein [Betaproteobacteria bacterium]|nr:VOC family protein [Betaproteobacteria bacterium]
MIVIDRIDHVVLTAHDLEATATFYQRVLGMEVVSFGKGRTALAFGRQKINLHQAGAEFEPKADRPTPGSLDLCFITETPIDKVLAHLRREGIEVIEGPVVRTGAQGALMSVYFRDPDNNLIEVSNQHSAED